MFQILAATAPTAGDINSAITATVGEVTSGLATVVGWWIVPFAITFFVAGTLLNLILGFFGKRRRSRRK